MEYSELKTKTAKTDFIREKLMTNHAWAIKGLKRIYEHQTASEQAMGGTTDHNGVGFTGVDGEILSSFAEQVNRGRTLSEKQLNLLVAKMPKYAKQLMRIAESEAEKVS